MKQGLAKKTLTTKKYRYFLTNILMFLVRKLQKKTVFRIRMDPGFFADPDPGFKSPDPDPSIKKFIRSK